MKTKFLLLILSVLAIASVVFADNSQVQSYKRTYSAYDLPLGPASSPTDICSLSGSSTALIRLTRVELSNAQTTSGSNSWFLIKRSTLNTAGTSVAMTAVPHDSTSAAATGVPKSWTANPGSLGTQVGIIRGASILSPSPGSLSANGTFAWDFDQNNSQENIILRGINDQVGLSFNGKALPSGMSVGCGFTWTEE